ncbi:MAG: hypothetical protein H5T44_00745 [Thermoplasmatales archaeon]|nr:hypothetical protein [Thermoplasmatales archaeon]
MFEKFKEGNVEIRKDEVWERNCRIMKRAGLEIDRQEDFKEIIEKDCIFCTKDKLAKFDFGFMENSHSFLFPNINPYAKYSGVCAFKNHYIKPEEFSAELLESNFLLCSEYIENFYDGKARYASINWNYLMPAGASILHPHTQVVLSEYPTTYMEKIIKNKDKFFSYIEEEIKGDRFIGKINGFYLFVPFAPFGFNEVFGFCKEENEVEKLALVISKILSYYSSIRRNSFNLAVFIDMDKEFPTHFRILTRQNMVKYYRNDAMFFERIHFETILEKMPEEVAKEIREFMK